MAAAGQFKQMAHVRVCDCALVCVVHVCGCVFLHMVERSNLLGDTKHPKTRTWAKTMWMLTSSAEKMRRFAIEVWQNTDGSC